MHCFRWSVLVYVAAASTPPVVITESGPVQGKRKDGLIEYHGVPFAAPPTGELRWKTPQPPEPWEQVLQTTKPGGACPQLDVIRGIHLGSEDCLFLSVYVPDTCTAEKLCPVMQWIHGGSWIIGSNFEGGRFNASQLAATYGVVVVAGNYRLDALGWLALEDMAKESADKSFGNFGLADQRAAMKWTQHNIKAFGGDSDTVTVFGESAGAFSVCQHTVSPLSNGLFTRAIIESGDCDGPWMIFDGDDATTFGDVFATSVGCPAGDSRMSCMRKMPLSKVMEPIVSWFCPKNGSSASQSLVKLRQKMGLSGNDPWCNRTSNKGAVPWIDTQVSPFHSRRWPTPVPPFAPAAGFAAVVDGTERGLPDVPLRLIRAGKVNKSPRGDPISVIMGTNHDELALFLILLPLTIPGTRLPWGDEYTSMVTEHFAKYHSRWNETTSQQILAQYPASDFKTAAHRMMTLGTDFIFRCGTRRSVRAFAGAGIPTYMYSFNYHSGSYKDPSSWLCELDDEIGCGVHHAAELPYVFGHVGAGSDSQMASIIGRYWSNFAKHGSPNGVDMPTTWPKYDTAGDRHLELALPVINGSRLFKNNCDFWDSLPGAGEYPPSSLDRAFTSSVHISV